jgi:MYXO-CTERM domain-containing protein
MSNLLHSLSRNYVAASLGAGLAFVPLHQARAGVPECGGVRVEDALNCEIRGNVDCNVGCESLGVYKVACATKLHKVCRSQCTLDPEATCTDNCTVSCKEQCDAGINITCSHNCFAECRGSCDLTCADAADPSQCRAECEATCDGECDLQCPTAVDGQCYTHCIECCDGSCTAQVNMDCQTTCQDESFESCEYEFKADCQGSCSGDGALFCDNKFVLAGDKIPACVQAMVARGIDAVDLRASADVAAKASLCQVGGSESGGALAILGMGLWGWWRRRKHTTM